MADLITPEKLTDEDLDMKGTTRKEYENEYYKRVCSEIIENFLYLGSDFIASDKEALEKISFAKRKAISVFFLSSWLLKLFWVFTRIYSSLLRNLLKMCIACVVGFSVFF